MKRTTKYLAVVVSIMMIVAFAPVSAFASASGLDGVTPVEKSGDSGSIVFGDEDAGDLDAAEIDALELDGSEIEKTVQTDLPAVKISSVKASKSYVTVKWKKVSKKNRKKVKKVQIQYSTDKSFSSDVKTASTGSKNKSKKIKNLTKGTVYYFRVRGYTKSGDTERVSAWSAVKSVKTKGKAPVSGLSATDLTLAWGGTHEITLKSGTGSWSLEGKGVLKIKKKTDKAVTVEPKKVGTEKVFCKVGGNTYQCTVKVPNNRIGDPYDELGYALVIGQTRIDDFVADEGVTLLGVDYDSSKGKAEMTVETDEDTDETLMSLEITAKKPGRFTVTLNVLYEGEEDSEDITYAFIRGFRGSAKVEENEANYVKWRKDVLETLVAPDMSTWEIIDAIGTLIDSAKYKSMKPNNGLTLWYNGKGTCVSGAKMMCDFMNDLGVTNKYHFAGEGMAEDIFGWTVMYWADHHNTWVTLGGETYELNPTPEAGWPRGTVAR